ncbi:MAG: glycosyltransferase [Candidatus Kapabacteria bacterium]|nr:glycosyltransferase [Ignavibacteriota bacterium]MCW5885147.1 glycosyltransferase [Candidatus Kapabacteria bacterium]
MKIAYLSTFYPFRGGIAQFNAALYNEFRKNYDIEAYTFKVQYPNILFPGKTQFVQSDDIAEMIDSKRILNTVNPLTYVTTADKIKKYNPDILITKFWMPFFAPSLGYIAGKLSKSTKRISILDNVIPHELRYGDITLINYFLNRNDGFVVMSDAVKRDLLRIKPDAKYIFHPHPLYDHFGEKVSQQKARAELGLPVDKKVILTFGFIRDYKGIDLAISAMKILGDEYYLIIAGEVYGSFDKYQTQIDELGINSKISLFTKYISDAETSLFFSAADVCLLPYKSATQSGIVAISYHFDLPVIATNVGGLAEMIEPCGGGIMTKNVSAESIADTVNHYFSENDVEFTSNIQSYKKQASWDSLAQNIIKFSGEI